MSAIADSGCQSCLSGIKAMPRLGMKQFDLIPVTIKMLTANIKGITILGATILRISEQGKIVETNDINIQMTYITDNLDKLFVSREA